VLLRRPETAAAFWTDAPISADGSTLTIVTASGPPKPQPGTVTVWHVLFRTRKRRIIYQVHGSGGQVTEIFFSPGATGRHFLIDAGPAGHPANGWIRHGKLAPLQPRASKVRVFYERWQSAAQLALRQWRPCGRRPRSARDRLRQPLTQRPLPWFQRLRGLTG
jgi:hypothetical protein